MGKTVDPMAQKVQKSISFEMRQHLFFKKYPDFKPDVFCRVAVDEQIKLIDEAYVNLTFEDIKIGGKNGRN